MIPYTLLVILESKNINIKIIYKIRKYNKK